MLSKRKQLNIIKYILGSSKEELEKEKEHIYDANKRYMNKEYLQILLYMYDDEPMSSSANELYSSIIKELG